MPGVAQRVECPNCWHLFNPIGKSINRANRRKAPSLDACDECGNDFEPTSSRQRYCNRACQIAAYGRKRSAA